MGGELLFYTALVVAINSLSLLALGVILAQPKSYHARLFGLICLSNISYMLSIMANHPDPDFRIDYSAYWLPLQFTMNMGNGLLMILCHSLFEDAKRFPRSLGILFFCQLILSTLRPLFVPNRITDIDVEAIGRVAYFLFGQLPLILQSLFVLIALYWILRGWRADLVEDRRLLRAAIFALVAVLFLGIVSSNLYLMRADPDLIPRVGGATTYLSALAYFALALICLRFDPQLFKEFAQRLTREGLNSAENIEADLATFHRLFEQEKCFLEPGLSMADLARKMAMPQYRLRALINRNLAFRNFNAMLNEYRVKEACRIFDDQEKNNLPILTIALSVGYQSIAPFNQAFKELLKMTPSAYRKRAATRRVNI